VLDEVKVGLGFDLNMLKMVRGEIDIFFSEVKRYLITFELFGVQKNMVATGNKAAVTCASL
jgi:hypothetical protein